MEQKLITAIEELKQEKNVNENFTCIYEATQKDIARIIQKRIPSGIASQTDTKTLVEDISQEVYTKIFKGIKTLKDPECFYGWVKVIALNATSAYLETHGKHVLVDSIDESNGEDESAEEPEDVTTEYRPEEVAINEENKRIIWRFVNELPKEQSAVLLAFYGEECKIKEIAEATGVSENTIKTRLRYGKSALMKRKAEFKKCGIDLALIPVAVLLHSIYKSDTGYAMELADICHILKECSPEIISDTIAAEAAISSTGTEATVSSVAEKSAEAAVSGSSAASAATGSSSTASAIGAGTATAKAVGVGAATAKAVGTGIVVKATIAVAAVASAAVVGTTAYQSTFASKETTAVENNIEYNQESNESALEEPLTEEMYKEYANALYEYASNKHLSLKDASVRFVNVDGTDTYEMHVNTGWNGIQNVTFVANNGTIAVTAESSDVSEEDYKTADDTLSYNDLCEKAGLPELTDEEFTADVTYQALYADALRQYAAESGADLDSMSITLVDVDLNGTPEMFMRTTNENKSFAVYAIVNGTVKLIDNVTISESDAEESGAKVSSWAVLSQTNTNAGVGYITIYDHGDHLYEITDNHVEEIASTNGENFEYGIIRGEQVAWIDASNFISETLDEPTRRYHQSVFDGYYFDANNGSDYFSTISFEELENGGTTEKINPFAGAWMGMDSLSQQKITYYIQDGNTIEYTIESPFMDGAQHGSTTFEIDDETIYLDSNANGQFPLDNGDSIYLSGGGILERTGDNLIAYEYGEDNSYEIQYTKIEQDS